MCFPRELESEHSIRFTVPAGWGRPQGSIATYTQDRKRISGRRHQLFGFRFPDSTGTGELKSRVLRHAVDTHGSEAKFDRSDRDYIESLNGNAQVPAIATIHPIHIDEAVLPQPGTDRLDAARILELIRRISPDSDPVFEVLPTIIDVESVEHLGGSATVFHGNAVVNARVGTAEAQNVRMRLVCRFDVVYSKLLSAVVEFRCHADGAPFENLNNSESLQFQIDFHVRNSLRQRLASHYASMKR